MYFTASPVASRSCAFVMFLNRGAEDEKNNPVHHNLPINPGSDSAEQNYRMYTLPAGGSATQEEPNKYFSPVFEKAFKFLHFME
jgi:hypothetical protein